MHCFVAAANECLSNKCLCDTKGYVYAIKEVSNLEKCKEHKLQNTLNIIMLNRVHCSLMGK